METEGAETSSFYFPSTSFRVVEKVQTHPNNPSTYLVYLANHFKGNVDFADRFSEHRLHFMKHPQLTVALLKSRLYLRAWKNNRPTLWARSPAGFLEALKTLLFLQLQILMLDINMKEP